MDNYRKTIISEYSGSPTLNQLIESFNEYIDPSANLDDFYNLVWNVDTAVGYGLDVWGRIVGVIRLLHVSNGKYFGFHEATSVSADPFGQSPFYNGATLNSNFYLSDAAFRTLILAKALANISDGSVKSINAVLRLLFPGRGNAYVTDGHNMTMTYTFVTPFVLTPTETAIVSQSGVLPRPAGVSVTVVQI